MPTHPTQQPNPTPLASPATGTPSVTKSLTLGDGALFHLILSQAGTLSKALAELISNSIDAGASSVHVTLSDTGYTVTDDGRGFRSEEEVDLHFSMLAFDHSTAAEAGKRQFGRFGIGRGQQWAFARTVYRSRFLSMDVDPRTRGFEFVLRHHADEFPGTEITGTLYDRLSLSVKAYTEKDLSDAVYYITVPVYLNGKRISRDPAGERWDFEDEIAWYKFNDGNRLKLYNMGMFVKDYSSFQFGIGGTIVSKPDRPFEVNMARNDVLTSQCMNWQHVERVARRQARHNTKRARLSENDYQTIISELLEHPEKTDRERLESLKLYVDHKGRNLTAWEFLAQATAYDRRVLGFAEEHQRALTRLHTNKQVFVIHPRTFTRIGTPTDGRTRMEHLRLVTECLIRRITPPHTAGLVRGVTVDPILYLEEIPAELVAHSERYETFSTPPKHIHHTLKAINQGTLSSIIRNVRQFLFDEGQRPSTLANTARCGISDAARFWTNLNTLVIEQSLLEEGQRNAESWNRMLMLIARAVLNLLLDPGQEQADENNELEYRLMYSTYYTLLEWNLLSLTLLTQMAGRNELTLSAAMRDDLSNLFALDTAQQKLTQDPPV